MQLKTLHRCDARCGHLRSAGRAARGSRVAAEEAPKWQVDTALLYWGEGDGRVQDGSLTAAVRRAIDEDRFFDATLTFDALTGASPSGAVPSTGRADFHAPFGRRDLRVGRHAPLDDSFKDTRVALSVGWQQPLGESMRWDLGVSASHEYDYRHLGLNGAPRARLQPAQHHAFAGAAYGKRRSIRSAAHRWLWRPMRALAGNSQQQGAASETKDVTDVLFGVTQVLSRRSLLEVLFLRPVDGYLTDPYKILSVVDPVSGLAVAGPAGSGRNLYLFENRPMPAPSRACSPSGAMHSTAIHWR